MNESLTGCEGGVGGLGAVGSAYLLGGKRISHLSGFYSPAFRSRDTTCNLEVIKHESENRFTYWLSRSLEPMLGIWNATPLTTNQVFQGLNKFSLWETDWTLLDAALKPVSTNAPLARLTLVDSVDVGYLKDEKRAEFAVNYRLPGLSYLAFAMDGECDGTRLVDVGRPVIGWADMRVRLKPGADAVAVARLAAKAEGIRANMYAPAEKMSLEKETRLNVFVDGEQIASVQATLDDGDGCFTEIAFSIPGHAIKSDSSLVQIFGDHLAFAYWFYQ